MAAEYSANALQTVNATQPIIFTESPVPCNKGLIYHRDESGNFLLANNAPNNCNTCNCGCRRIYETRYAVTFSANIGVPTGGTVEEIQVGIAIDGTTDPSSIMRFTPAAVEEFGNISKTIVVSVPSLCGCENVSVRNISTQPIEVQNANIVIDYIGVQRVR